MTVYILKLSDVKYLNRLVQNKIKFQKIKYQNKSCLLYVDKENYDKLKKYLEIYDITLERIEGLEKYLFLLKKNIIFITSVINGIIFLYLLSNIIFIISVILGLVFLYLLSNMIFDIKIMTDKKDLVKILNNELEYYGISKYHFVKSFKEKEEIKNKILNDYKDKFEWLEIDRVGSRYYIRVLERIINKKEDNEVFQNVVAKKNAVIMEIRSSSGQIIKKLNDYVNKGDVIISGNITKKDEIKNVVKAEGIVYGETWYNVKVELPRSYERTVYTGNSYNRYTLDIFDKKFFLFGKKDYKEEEYDNKEILSSNILPFSFNKTKIKEVKKVFSIYTYDEALNKGIEVARSKLLNNLDKDSKILFQKKLKLYEEHDKIIVEVFFKVYENITDYQEINIIKEDNYS